MHMKLTEYNLLPNTPGIYYIKNTKNGKCYIGSTVMTFRKRMEHHLWHLRENKHKNKHFQNEEKKNRGRPRKYVKITFFII